MKEDLIPDVAKRALYCSMSRIRFFEEKVIEFYHEQEMRTPVHLCIGQEAIAAAVCHGLDTADYIFSTHRNHGHCLAKGMSYYQLLAEFYGKETGCAGGKGGSMHPVDVTRGILGTTAIVGGNIPLAVGAAWSSQMKKDNKVAVAFFGDGASEEGTFHESLNFAALKKIPTIFICENNLYATTSPIAHRQPPGTSIADRAAAYGMPSQQMDGNDVLQVYCAAEEAIRRARRGEGPSFIEAMTYRWKAHVGPVDDTAIGHRPQEELAVWQTRCPIARLLSHLEQKGLWSEEKDRTLVDKLEREFNTALQQAKNDPFPQDSNIFNFVFRE